MMKLQPLNDRVLVRRKEPEKMTATGLHIPDSAQGKAQLATVEAIGPGRYLDDGTRCPMTVSVGDTVVLAKWTGQELPDEPDLLMVREDEILATVSTEESPV